MIVNKYLKIYIDDLKYKQKGGIISSGIAKSDNCDGDKTRLTDSTFSISSTILFKSLSLIPLSTKITCEATKSNSSLNSLLLEVHLQRLLDF